jgi:hypothetical protein
MSSWGTKITKKMVDPITFSCPVTIAFLPRIEDCLYETTCLAQAHPRIPGGYGHNHPNSRSSPSSSAAGDDHHHQHHKRSSSPSASTTSCTSSISTTATSATTPNTSIPKPLAPSARDRNPYFSSPSPPNKKSGRTRRNSTRTYNSTSTSTTSATNTNTSTKEEKWQNMNKFADSAWATPFGDEDEPKKPNPMIAPAALPPSETRKMKKLNKNTLFASFEELSASLDDLDFFGSGEDDFQDEKKQDPSACRITAPAPPPETRNVKKLNKNTLFASFELSASLDDLNVSFGDDFELMSSSVVVPPRGGGGGGGGEVGVVKKDITATTATATTNLKNRKKKNSNPAPAPSTTRSSPPPLANTDNSNRSSRSNNSSNIHNHKNKNKNNNKKDEETKQDPSSSMMVAAAARSPPEENVKKLNNKNMVFASFELSASSKDLDGSVLSSFSDFEYSAAGVSPPRRGGVVVKYNNNKDATTILTSDTSSKYTTNSNPAATTTTTMSSSSSSPPPNTGDGRRQDKVRNNLGAFLKMVSQKTAIAAVEADNQSISSKQSLSSRSVADRSHAERSKAEQKLAEKTHPPLLHHGGGGGGDHEPSPQHNNTTSPSKRRTSRGLRPSNQSSLAMRSIDELSLAEDFSGSSEEKKNHSRPSSTPSTSTSGSNSGGSGLLSNFLTQTAPVEEEQQDDGGHNKVDADARSVMSGSTLGSRRSISQRSTADRSKTEKKLAEMVKSPYREKQKLIIKEDSREDLLEEEEDDDDTKSLTMDEVAGIVILEKKLSFQDGHEEFEISYPTNSMYDDLYWTEDELADFRYVAFLEEAGLDVDEYM